MLARRSPSNLEFSELFQKSNTNNYSLVGKTFTMQGPPNNPGMECSSGKLILRLYSKILLYIGIIPRAVRALFKLVEEKKKSGGVISIKVKMSYFEIYNNKVPLPLSCLNCVVLM